MKQVLLLFMLLACGIHFSWATTYLVTNTNDSGSGSLRDAIRQAEMNPGHDFIHFNIQQPGGPVYRIVLDSLVLETLDDQAGVTIDGYTQPGSSPGNNPPSTATPLIILDGASIDINIVQFHYSGLFIRSSSNVIKGLVVQNFPDHGIVISPYQNQNAFNNHIYANFVGTDITGQFPGRGNGKYGFTVPTLRFAGIQIATPPGANNINSISRHNLIERNLIGDNFSEGVSIVASPPGQVDSNIVRKNYIGTTIDGMGVLGNYGAGVYLGESTRDNLLDSNLISANFQEGVSISGQYVSPDEIRITSGNRVFNNIIGLAIDEATPLPNLQDGISIGAYGYTRWGFAIENWVHANHIAHNMANGVEVVDFPVPGIPNAYGNKITTNSIHENDSLGINLGTDQVTLNDPNDFDQGPNGLFNYPIIQNVQFNYANQLTSANGIVQNGTPYPGTRIVEVFAVHPDPSGHGEGMRYAGRTVFLQTVNNWSVGLYGVYPGDIITATVIDSFLGNTSEFSMNVPVVGMPLNAFPVITHPSCANSNDGAITLTPVGGTSIYSYNWSTGATTQSVGGLSSGIYYATVYDHYGNNVPLQMNLNGPPPLDPGIFANDASCSTCADGSVLTGATGGTPPYQYLWEDGSTFPTLDNLMPGSYCLTVTDANMCVTTTCQVVSFLSSVDSPDELAEQINLFPNPVSTNLTIELPAMADPVNIRVFSNDGRLMFEDRQVFGSQYQLDVSTFPQGTFWISFRWEDRSIGSKRLVIVR